MKTKTLIRIGLAVMLSLTTGSFARAQDPDDATAPHHRHGPPNLTAMLTHTLALTDAQKTQVQTMVTAVQPQLDAIHAQARAQADVIIKQLNVQIRPLLTPEQQKKLDALETLRDSGPHGPPPE